MSEVDTVGSLYLFARASLVIEMMPFAGVSQVGGNFTHHGRSYICPTCSPDEALSALPPITLHIPTGQVASCFLRYHVHLNIEHITLTARSIFKIYCSKNYANHLHIKS